MGTSKYNFGKVHVLALENATFCVSLTTASLWNKTRRRHIVAVANVSYLQMTFVNTFWLFPRKRSNFLNFLSCTRKRATKPLKEHKEHWEYPVKDDNRKIVGKKVTKKKMTNGYYCLQTECVVKRHPYFWKGLIRIRDEIAIKLKESHKKLLRDTFHINF